MAPKAIVDPEFAAIGTIYQALSPLEAEAQLRVVKYVVAKLNIKMETPRSSDRQSDLEAKNRAGEADDSAIHNTHATEESGQDDLEGISPAGKKWMARNGMRASELATIFSLGIDEIDLVAEKVPGTNKKERMRSVYLLKGVAAYLGGGVASFTQAQVKEALLHYDAFDSANNAAYFGSLSSEVSGTKEAGYSLTPRGLSSATALLKSMTKTIKPT